MRESCELKDQSSNAWGYFGQRHSSAQNVIHVVQGWCVCQTAGGEREARPVARVGGRRLGFSSRMWPVRVAGRLATTSHVFAFGNLRLHPTSTVLPVLCTQLTLLRFETWTTTCIANTTHSLPEPSFIASIHHGRHPSSRAAPGGDLGARREL